MKGGGATPPGPPAELDRNASGARPSHIDVFVCKLRKKLTAGTGGENYIETVWGRGYVLRDPADELGRGEEDHKQVANL